ncbi:LiaI-LiaF-like domain-containing protein [Alkalicoccus daliensis]|uniref:LiaI-LiaF-like transmembrane region domain-containing protein n=1 Tax=Alkalicoccus daliensis TaxID=745820 RepID=A0A1H0CJD0_9BACI|nr:DUF5668 domain-containing protein [Alkalicoccus daliensis]SDN57997.1 hypothetical protein SAMN04488053_102125 [Alkalicoccus daliensis]
MKSNNILPGIILLVTGLYFLAGQWEVAIPFTEELLRWPTILLGIGAVLMWLGFSNKDAQHMFSGAVLTGLGVLFHGSYTFQLWQHDWPYFTLVIGIAFLLKYFVNKRDGLGTGLILLAITAAALFSAHLLQLLQFIPEAVLPFWPLLFIIAGVYLIFFGRSRKGRRY